MSSDQNYFASHPAPAEPHPPDVCAALPPVVYCIHPVTGDKYCVRRRADGGIKATGIDRSEDISALNRALGVDQSEEDIAANLLLT